MNDHSSEDEPAGLQTAERCEKIRKFRRRNKIALLTGGGDKPYALGLAAALTSWGIDLDFIGSDDLDVPQLSNKEGITFLNLRGDQRPDASATTKAIRIVKYYFRITDKLTPSHPPVNPCPRFSRRVRFAKALAPARAPALD